VADTARRISSRSIAHPISAAATTATTTLTASGQPSARCAVQPMNVETISISPCAKFSVRVAL